MANSEDVELRTEETVTFPREIVSHGIVYKDPYKKIERITAEFEGFRKEYFVSDFGAKAAVLAVRESQVLLVRQYRLLLNDLSLEVPAGKTNHSESPSEAAVRECLEETGVHCEDLRPLIEYDPDLEYSRNHTSVFYTDRASDCAESSNRIWVPYERCLEMVYDGTIRDSLSIIAILAYGAKQVRAHGPK